MANLLASLYSSANALHAYDQVLNVTQNNVANASTAGYAKQRQSLQAMAFEPALGVLGGVRAGEVESARNQYAEVSVRRQALELGAAQQQVNSLSSLEALFDVSGESGIAGALNRLFDSFSAWGQSPTDATARQAVIDRAGDLATAFHQTTAGLSNLAQDTEGQIDQTVTRVNQIVSQLQGFNRQIMAGARNDAGIDAQVNFLLEDLSQYVDCTAIQQSDGSVSLLLNGETPLLLEGRQYTLRYALDQPEDPPPNYPNAPRRADIYASDGTDITAKTTGGQLGALLDFHNTLLASYIGDAYHEGDLNTLARSFARRVNDLLQSGYVNEDDPPQTGSALFQVDPLNATNAAKSLAVIPSVTAAGLGSIDPGPPYVFNGIPLKLSKLAAPDSDADRIQGASFSAYFGSLASRAGYNLNNAQNELQVRQGTLAQAKDLRQQMSGVSLDEEATIMMQFQRAYEANSRIITVLDQLTQDLINILQR